jgi:hypothetical protein
MRYITGDSRLNFHSFRHSFANWISQALIKPLDQEKSSKLEIVKNHFGFNATRRPLFQLASLMGHAHPVTTIINYIHNFDEELTRLQKESNSLKVSYDFLQTVTGFSYAQLRQWKSRHCKSISLLEFCLTRLPATEETAFDHELEHQPLKLPISSTAYSYSEMDFRKLDWFISRIGYQPSVNCFSTILSQHPKAIYEMVEASKFVIAKSGYLTDSLIDFASNTFVGTNTDQLKKTALNDSHIPKTANWITAFKQQFFEHAGVEAYNFVDLWMQYVQPSEPHWRFETTEQTLFIYKYLESLGFNQNAISLKGYSGEKPTDEDMKKIKFNELSPDQKHLSGRKYYQITPNQNAASILIHKNNIPITRVINHYVFLSSIWLLAKKMSANL